MTHEKIDLFIDMDGIVYDLVGEFIKHYKRLNPECKVVRSDIIGKKYHGWTKDIFGISEEDAFSDLGEDFFSNMNPIEDSKETINNLYESGNFNIRFVTMVVSVHAFCGKVKALLRDFKWFSIEDNLISMKDKWLLVGDSSVYPSVFIDDNESVIKGCLNRDHVVLSLNIWDHNTKIAYLSDLNYIPCTNWDDIYKYLMRILNKYEK